MHPSDANSEICSKPFNCLYIKVLCLALSPILNEMLFLPHPKQLTRRKRRPLNSEGLCITDSEVLDGLKANEEEKMEKQRKKSERKEQSHWRLKDEKLKQKRKERAKRFKQKNMTTKKKLKSQHEPMTTMALHFEIQ